MTADAAQLLHVVVPAAVDVVDERSAELRALRLQLVDGGDDLPALSGVEIVEQPLLDVLGEENLRCHTAKYKLTPLISQG